MGAVETSRPPFICTPRYYDSAGSYSLQVCFLPHDCEISNVAPSGVSIVACATISGRLNGKWGPTLVRSQAQWLLTELHEFPYHHIEWQFTLKQPENPISKCRLRLSLFIMKGLLLISCFSPHRYRLQDRNSHASQLFSFFSNSQSLSTFRYSRLFWSLSFWLYTSRFESITLR
jgi:hypothetical protein